MKKILFAPPYITSKEIRLVKKVLKSGWVTTGPMVMSFESLLKDYVQAERVLCLSSATAGLELVLRLYGVGEGDEVITTPYTFTATAAVAIHVGAKPVLVDIGDDFNISPDKIYDAITEKTKAIIPVDFGGKPCDYDRIFSVVNSKSYLFKPKNSFQESLGRPLIIGDAAHSFGSIYKSKKVGTLADFTVFSFHAVKNITTAEGGAITIKSFNGFKADEIYKRLKIMSLHGQSKDAFIKGEENKWFYSILEAGYKYNMTDIQAAIGIAQLSKYENMLKKRREIFNSYNREFASINEKVILPELDTTDTMGNAHLYPLRLKKQEIRDDFINYMFKNNIQCNVHFIPLPLHPLYKNLGYKIEDYPVAHINFLREVSLPIYPHLSYTDFKIIVKNVLNFFKKF
ncbi:MAG TPA: DegT/DnrJ/EryC1/StrS aminotransferase family protein [Spirochaetota bacterium]|nr:DegT/DnrJ/EryC1/StrS aminotransferase family protein [Spirochaetota bacterium]HOM38305.1 DegT/DnrJ/EryC1/StrS aminotransferase family protein [Spirochaetota bacterium]HPQ48477.1 DegT/DnrJ/EryC1/StrS aminotransferase family protein [Spirochaetota bacterium]